MTIVPGADLCHGGVLSMAPDPAIIDPHYLLGVCNSSIFWAFVQHKMPTMGIGRHTIRLERLRQFPLVVPGSENQSLVKAIAGATRRLIADTLSPLERKEIMADTDHMVRELYGLEEKRFGAA